MIERDESASSGEGPVVLPQDISFRDVLCGKDKRCINHEGSKHFKAVINEYAERYQRCLSKFEKMNITKEIYERMTRQSSRFLKHNSKDDSWHIIPVPHIRDKIGHALRFSHKKAVNAKGRKERKDKRKKEAYNSTVSPDSDATTATASSQDSYNSSIVAEQRPTRSPRPTPMTSPPPLVQGVSSLVKSDFLQFPEAQKLERGQFKSVQVPSSVSFSKEQPQSTPFSDMAKNTLPEPAPLTQNFVPLPDEDILWMLREPLVDFDPNANQINTVQL